MLLLWFLIAFFLLVVILIVLRWLLTPTRCARNTKRCRNKGDNGAKRNKCDKDIKLLHTHFDVLDVPESHGTTTLVLSCIDYRFIDAVTELVREEEEVEFYDTFSLAGGSLGYNQTVYATWPQTFLDTVALAKSLHGITKIVVVEHMSCGMYKSIYPDAIYPKKERLHHIQNIHDFKTAMSSVEPTLTVHGYLLYENGDSERIV